MGKDQKVYSLPTNLRYCSNTHSSIKKFIHSMIFNGNFSDKSYSKTLIIPVGQKFRGCTKLEYFSLEANVVLRKRTMFNFFRSLERI